MRKFCVIFILFFISFSSAQNWPSSEVVSIRLFDSELPPSSAVCPLATAPCSDSGGYNPIMQSYITVYAAEVVPFTSGAITNWQIVGQNQCIVGIESCNLNTGNLIEIACGHDVWLGNASTFASIFLNNIWLGTEPAALLEINCTLYALNYPYLGLQGTCAGERVFEKCLNIIDILGVMNKVIFIVIAVLVILAGVSYFFNKSAYL